MYKLMLVDDDYLVLEFLSKMIPWNELGFEVIGLCEDGQQALNMMKETTPDVIITDIGMPKKDGMTLIRQAKEENPEIQSIFLTCYDDFKFAQEAVRLNAFDYILKETFDAESIINMVKRLKAEMDQAKISNRILSRMKFLIKENLITLRSKLLERILAGDPGAILQWLKKHEQELELESSYKNCVPVLSFIDDYEKLVRRKFSEDSLKFSIDNVITETIGRSAKGICLFYREDVFFLFYLCDGYISEEKIQRTMIDILANLRRYLKMSITTLVGKNSPFPNGLTEELHNMLDASEQRFYLEHGSVKKMNQISYSTLNPFITFLDSVQEVKRLIIREDRDGLKNWVENWKSSTFTHQYHPKVIKKWTMSLLFDIEKMIQSMQTLELEYTETVVNRSTVEAKTVNQLADWLLESLNHGITRMQEINHQPKKEEIVKAQKYVLLNLDKKISLGEVAAHLHLNPSYFSRLFKKHTNKNFIEYVNEKKIEEAKEFIVNTNESIEKIADRLGFESKGYFFKVFKKYYGVSPTEYRLDARQR